MLTHIVFFRMHPDCLGEKAELVQKFLGMKGKIDPLLDIEAGVDVVHLERSYDVALVTRFASLEDMQAYQVHPVHQEVVAYVKQVTASSASVDFTDV